MPNWKRVLVSGSDAALNSLLVTDNVTATSLTGSLQTDIIQFTAQTFVDGVEGQLGYSFDNGKLTFYTENNTPIDLGRSIYARVRNSEATTLTKGTVVDFTTTSTGQTPEVKRAIATSGTDCSCFVGVVIKDIPTNQFGYIMLTGVLNGLNLTTFNNGDQLYLSQTSSGSFTTDIPTPPVKAIRLGVVLNSSASPTQGLLFIRPENRTVVFDLANFKETYNTGSFSGSFFGNLEGTASFALTASFAETPTVEGPQGATGLTGATGPQGETGATGPQGTGVSWVDISTNTTASTNTGYFCDTSGSSFTLTLPASPSNGTIVGINDITGTFNTNPLIIDRNGALIQGIAENLSANLKNASFLLLYNDETNTWSLDTYLSQGFGDEVLIAGPQGATGPEGPPGVTGATADTGTEIDFTIPKIFSLPSSPETGNITDNLTGAVIGIVQKIYHNSGTAPTLPVGWISIGGSYVENELNIIYAEWISGTRVEYWVTQEQ